MGVTGETENNEIDQKEIMAFEEYALSEPMVEALTMLGYLQPTPIQQRVIPLLLQKQNVVGKSQTGSGKTAAFGIPICDAVAWEEHEPQALILEPTRELAVQVRDELFQIGRKRRLKIPVVFGGMPIDKELLSLKQKTHIVVGTPGRVLDHVKRGSLQLSKIRYLVIDEADLMLDMGFIEEVEQVLTQIKPECNISLFSATIGDSIDHLIQVYMRNPKYVEIEMLTQTAEGIEQIGYLVDKEEKSKILIRLLMVERPEGCMIFCATREMVNALYQYLKRKKIRCIMLHGGMEQRERLYAIKDFRAGKCAYLITTDVAARGIDFENVTHVINYDFPSNKENYVHRIGRTGRNGRTGKAISLIQPGEEKMLKAVEEYAGITVDLQELPDDATVEAGKKVFLEKQKEKIVLREGKGAVFNASIMRLSIGGGKKSKMRAGDIVGTLCNIKGIDMQDIGIIDIRDSISYVEIFNGKGNRVCEELQSRPIKGKLRKVQKTRQQ